MISSQTLQNDLRELEERHGRKYSRVERELILGALRALPEASVSQCFRQVVQEAGWGLPKARLWVDTASRLRYLGDRGVPVEDWPRFQTRSKAGFPYQWVAHPRTGIQTEEEWDEWCIRKNVHQVE